MDPPTYATPPASDYAGLLFLTSTLLLVGNASTLTLEFWDTASAPTRPLGALGLPSLSQGNYIFRMSCHCELGTAGPYSSKPFYAASDEAIAIFNIQVNHETADSFSMFVRRKSLLGLCPSQHEFNEDAPFEVIPWDAWGPDVTRWMQRSISSDPAFTTAGARAVLREKNMGLIVVDFNPARVQGIRTQQKRRLSDEESPEMKTWVEDGETVIVNPAWTSPLVSRLPYVARLWGTYEYDAVMLDEERLIGLLVHVSFPHCTRATFTDCSSLQTDETGTWIEEIVVLHLGRCE